MKYFYCATLLLFLGVSSFSQNQEFSEKYKDKSNSWFEGKGESYFTGGNVKEALNYYTVLNQRKPESEFYKYRLGICYLYKSDAPEKALELLLPLEKSKNKQVKYINYYIGRAQHVNENYKEAKEYYSTFLKDLDTADVIYKKANYNYSQCLSAIAIKQRAADNTKNDIVQVIPQSKSINGTDDEYFPVINADESTMMFTYRGPKSKGGMVNDLGEPDPEGIFYGEDIYQTSKDEKGDWKPAIPLDNLNSDRNDAAINLSPDGQTLIMFRNTIDSSGNIYLSRLDGSVWGKPKSLPGWVNSEYWEGSACISSNEQTMIFSSERPGGFGGRDLWRSIKLPNGNWSRPTNLGPKINTVYNEDAPFLFYDGTTLYFSSNNITSMGEYDIFYSSLQGDTAWTTPVNLGNKINTPFDDKFYVINASGSRGFFSSMRKKGQGQQDIYMAAPGHFGNTAVFVLKGSVYINEEPGYSNITVGLNNNAAEPSLFNSNSETGKYLLVFPLGLEYNLKFEADPCIPYTSNLDTRPFTEFKDSILDIHLYTQAYLDKYMKISGKVIDPETGKPLEGVKVELKSKDGTIMRTTYTDKLGNYVFNTVPKGKDYDIIVHYPKNTLVQGKVADLYDKGLAGVTINDQITGDDGSYKLTMPGTNSGDEFMTIAGKVTHPKTKKPIPGARVQLLSDDGTVVMNTVTDAEGNFVFKNVPKNKSYKIFVDYPTDVIVEGVITNNKDNSPMVGVKMNGTTTNDKGEFKIKTNGSGLIPKANQDFAGLFEKYLIPYSKDNLSKALVMDAAMFGEFLSKFGDYQTKDLDYKVQIGAYINSKNFPAFKYETLDKVDQKLYDDNLTRFVLATPYKTYRQVYTRTMEAKKIAYHDAFSVIFYKGQRMLIAKEFWKALKGLK